MIMSEKEIKPTDRLRRMQRMYSEYAGVLAEDYDFFTQGQTPQPDAPTDPNKAARKSATQHERPAPKPS